MEKKCLFPSTDKNLTKFVGEFSCVRQNYIPQNSQVTVAAEVTKDLDGRITLGPPSSIGKPYLITLKAPSQLKPSGSAKAIVNGLFTVAFAGAAAAIRWYRG